MFHLILPGLNVDGTFNGDEVEQASKQHQESIQILIERRAAIEASLISPSPLPPPPSLSGPCCHGTYLLPSLATLLFFTFLRCPIWLRIMFMSAHSPHLISTHSPSRPPSDCTLLCHKALMAMLRVVVRHRERQASSSYHVLCNTHSKSASTSPFQPHLQGQACPRRLRTRQGRPPYTAPPQQGRRSVWQCY